MKTMLPSFGVFLAVAVTLSSRAAPGDVDPFFNAGGISPPAFCFVNAILERPDGKLLIGGQFHAVGGVLKTNLAQLHTNGSLDSLFLKDVAGPVGTVHALANYPGERIVVAGTFNSISGMSRTNLARLNSDGSLDASFLDGMTGPNQTVKKIAVQPDGKILIQGSFTMVNGVERLNIARLNENGSMDQAFAPVFTGTVSPGNPVGVPSIDSLLLLPDGRMMVGGGFRAVDGLPATNIARLHPDGTLDPSFVLRLIVPSTQGFECLALLPGDRVLCRSDYYVYNGPGGPFPVYPIHRLESNGLEDQSFLQPGIPLGVGWVSAVVVRENGGFLVGGAFGPVHAPEPSGCAHFAAFHEDGSFDSSYLAGQSGPGNGPPVTSLIKQADGKVVIGGPFTAFNGVHCLGLTRLTGDCNTLQIAEDPASRTAEIGTDVIFRVRAAGYPPPVYRWYFGGEPLGAEKGTNGVLRLLSVQSENAGAYYAVIQNALPPLTSAPAMLGVIDPVERRAVARIGLAAQPGTELHVEYAPEIPGDWTGLGTATIATGPGYVFDLAAPAPPQRFYRAWQSAGSATRARLDLQLIPEITLRGSSGAVVRIDWINALGPTNAWITLDTVTMTNTTQVYFDNQAAGQPARLYRLLPVP